MTATGIEVVSADESLDDVRAVRRAVFVEEQGVPEHREYDGLDEDATHLLARADGEPIGTTRLRAVDDALKIERVAVVQSARGDGWGRRLMERAESIAEQRGFDRVVLHGQTAVEGFYHELGYETTSDVFEDAGIPHVEMEKSL